MALPKELSLTVILVMLLALAFPVWGQPACTSRLSQNSTIDLKRNGTDIRVIKEFTSSGDNGLTDCSLRCCETENCSLVIFTEKRKHNCLLIYCPSDDVCNLIPSDISHVIKSIRNNETDLDNSTTSSTTTTTTGSSPPKSTTSVNNSTTTTIPANPTSSQNTSTSNSVANSTSQSEASTTGTPKEAATTSSLKSDNATTSSLKSDNATTSSLKSDNATTSSLKSDNATTSSLKSDNATIFDLETDNATTSSPKSDNTTGSFNATSSETTTNILSNQTSQLKESVNTTLLIPSTTPSTNVSHSQNSSLSTQNITVVSGFDSTGNNSINGSITDLLSANNTANEKEDILGDQPIFSNDSMMVILMATLSVGMLLLISILAMVTKRAVDGWQRRHYSRIDYLVNGMYN